MEREDLEKMLRDPEDIEIATGGAAGISDPERRVTLSTMKGLPDLDEFWGWLQKLAERGPRFTGNAAQRGFVDELQSQLQNIGLTVHRDELYFRRWEATRWELRLHGVPSGEEVLPVTYYYPYSGETPSQGVTGELVHCGGAPGNYAQAAGKIAVVEARILPLPALLFWRRSGKMPFARSRVPFMTVFRKSSYGKR